MANHLDTQIVGTDPRTDRKWLIHRPFYTPLSQRVCREDIEFFVGFGSRQLTNSATAITPSVVSINRI